MSNTIKLNGRQINFITEMTGILEPQKALDRFMQIMKEEGISSMEVTKVINKIMERMGK